MAVGARKARKMSGESVLNPSRYERAVLLDLDDILI
jgi:hypothetical protein